MPYVRVLVISDIHANLAALDAVLQSCGPNGGKEAGYDAVWCLGDLVGYGPDPNECISRVRALPSLLCLIGNHDQAALGLTPLARFNLDARLAAAWTQEALSEDNKAFLRSLPNEIQIDSFTMAHGSPRQPIWEYILDHRTADANFDIVQTDYSLVGHSHIPLVFQRTSEEPFASLRAVDWDQPMALNPRMILNPGSVGQPRDMDPRAAFALLDLEQNTWEARRVAYDIAQVQGRMLEAGLPERQALRLTAGW